MFWYANASLRGQKPTMSHPNAIPVSYQKRGVGHNRREGEASEEEGVKNSSEKMMLRRTMFS